MAASLTRVRIPQFFVNFTNCKALKERKQCLFNLIKSCGDKVSHYERKLVGYSQEQMYQVVSDTSRYPEFLPWCHQSKAVGRRGLIEHVQLTVGFTPFEETYLSEVCGENYNEQSVLPWSYEPEMCPQASCKHHSSLVTFTRGHALARYI